MNWDVWPQIQKYEISENFERILNYLIVMMKKNNLLIKLYYKIPDFKILNKGTPSSYKTFIQTVGKDGNIPFL